MAATPETAPADLLSIELTYKTPDRFGNDRFSDPNVALVQRIGGEIEGLTDDDEERRVPLGSIRLARIDLWEIGDRYLDVLDAESSEWTTYTDVLRTRYDDGRFLLIVDRVEIVPWARGNDIGLHAMARAIRTWGEDALVVLIASPPGAFGPGADAGGEALSRHWARLGLERVDGSSPPVLAGSTQSAQLAAALADLSDWQPPAPTPSTTG